MPIDHRNVINSPIGLKLAHALGKYTPYWLGNRIAMFVADRISSRKKWKMVQNIRCNQWIVNDQPEDTAVVDRLVQQNIRSTAQGIFDFYHVMENPAASRRMIEPNPFVTYLLERPEFTDRGLVLAGLHTTNFDIGFLPGALAGIKAYIITVPRFNGAHEDQFERRRNSGLNVVPASMGTIKRGVEFLRQGGVVATAMDWPDPSSGYRPSFFGRPSTLPIHHIFMALKGNAPVVIVAVLRKPGGKYCLKFSESIEMQPHPDRQQEIMLNAERVLNIAEGYIRGVPTQWSMSYQVWPEAMDEVP